MTTTSATACAPSRHSPNEPKAAGVSSVRRGRWLCGRQPALAAVAVRLRPLLWDTTAFPMDPYCGSFRADATDWLYSLVASGQPVAIVRGIELCAGSSLTYW